MGRLFLAKQHLRFAEVFAKLVLHLHAKLFSFFFPHRSKRKRGYEEDGHVAKEPRLVEEVRQANIILSLTFVCCCFFFKQFFLNLDFCFISGMD